MPDYRDLPSYTVSEVAQCLCIPSATVRYWAKGRGDHKPVIAIPDYHRRPTLLSFLNLAELHVLSSIRREHKIPLPKVRVAQHHLIAIARELSESTHPLISYELQTDGLDIFVERVGALINASRGGQQEMRPLMEDVFNVRQANWHMAGGASPPKRRSNRSTFLRKPCVGTREGAGEASAAVREGGAMERRKGSHLESRDPVEGRRQHRAGRYGET